MLSMYMHMYALIYQEHTFVKVHWANHSSLTAYIYVRSFSWVSDLDECTLGNGGCNQTCVNLDGSYTCACPPGQELADDQYGCIGKFLFRN